MKRKGSLYVLGFSLFLFLTTALQAQISAPGSSGSGKTSYPVFQATDSIFVFCAANEMGLNGVLRVQTQLQGSKTFLWEKYNPSSDVFEFYFSENSANQQSAINGLADGCYRATVTLGGTTEVHRAWVFNNWITGSGSSTDSNCQSFKLIGTFLSGSMIYYDLANHTEQEVFKDMKVQWKLGQEVIASVLNPQIFNPPSKDTKYTFRVYDRFGCDFSTEVNYSSIVTDAKFSVDPKEGEAPLTVNFVNHSYKFGSPFSD